MFYERKVKYLNHLVKQEKCSNAGFIKLEARGDVCNITINVSNLRETDSFSAKVYLICKEQEKELCSLELLHGKGVKLLQRQELNDIAHTGISYRELEAVRIPISSEREIYGVVGQAEGSAEVQAASEQQKVTERQMASEQQAAAERENVGNSSMQVIEEKNTEDETEFTDIEEDYQEEEEPLKQTKKEARKAARKAVTERRVPLYDDKWKQLWEIYPHITPFRDGREYLSVGPNDFVILPGKYFRMANNSFLLHGYYNYKHLVLKKMEYHGEVRYYIGVPGNFYDREKQVAVMFGFESFESLEEPARTGDYGYYLMRIEL